MVPFHVGGQCRLALWPQPTTGVIGVMAKAVRSRISEVPAPTELTEVGVQIDSVFQPRLQAGSVGVSLGAVAGLGLTIGPPM